MTETELQPKLDKLPSPSKSEDTVKIPKVLYDKLTHLGIIDSGIRSTNVGASNYSKHLIQPWSIWLEYKLDAWDADIIKRILRTKETDSRELDYKKVIHICQEKLRQLKE